MESLKRLTALLTAVAAHKFDLILYGADAWRNAGNRSHLEDVVSQLTDVKSKPDVLVAALDGHSDPKDWLKSTRAVITAAGPFSIHGGEELLRAAAELGVHYADTSDEFYWQRWMIDRYDQVAQKSGSKVVLSSGFCVLAGDLGAQLALRPLQNRSADASVASLDAWLEGYNGGVSAGVIHTAEAMKNASFPKAWETDPYVLAPNATADLRKDTKVEGMHYPSWVSGEGVVVPNIFGPYDARLLRRSFVQLEQAVTLRVGATAGMYPKWTAFIAEHPGSWSKLTKCPTETVYKDGSWSYRFHASAGQRRSGVLLSGHGDPGYRFTAVGLAETGLCLAGKTSKCPKPNAAGVLTPMAALEATVLKARLESIDLLKVDMLENADVNEIIA
ncbi:Putative trans-acting enoyl reductase MT2525 [Durusdinium trenchii]|uniref:Trans-acting enoyl reductase MT2525 n=1 Tax=Durusdinium trenchii TaxID=1381693 RepID=A0ABP0L9F1_9DINO